MLRLGIDMAETPGHRRLLPPSLLVSKRRKSQLPSHTRLPAMAPSPCPTTQANVSRKRRVNMVTSERSRHIAPFLAPALWRTLACCYSLLATQHPPADSQCQEACDDDRGPRGK